MKLSVFQTLIDEGLIDDKQLEECQAVVKQSGEPLDRILRSKGFVSEGDLLQVLGRMLRFDFKDDLETVEVPKEFTQKVPAQFARNYNLIGLARELGRRSIRIARAGSFPCVAGSPRKRVRIPGNVSAISSFL